MNDKKQPVLTILFQPIQSNEVLISIDLVVTTFDLMYFLNQRESMMN